MANIQLEKTAAEINNALSKAVENDTVLNTPGTGVVSKIAHLVKEVADLKASGGVPNEQIQSITNAVLNAIGEEVVNGLDLSKYATLASINNESMHFIISEQGTMPNSRLNTDGTINVDTTYNLTDYIEIQTGYDKMIVSKLEGGEASNIIAFFDENKSALGRVYSDPMTFTSQNEYKYNIPIGAKYFVTYQMNNVSNIIYTTFITLQNSVGVTVNNSIVYPNLKVESGVIPTSKLENVKNFLKYEEGLIKFKVSVNINNPTYDINNANQEIVDYYDDYAVLALPKNYSASGKPVRLIITCHGTGTWYNNNTTTITNMESYIGCGYAILDVNAMPHDFAGSVNEADISSKRHYGAPFALQAYIKAYRYVIDNYNIANDGVFIHGISMGGLSSFMLAQSGGIPVIAQAAFCPCIDLFKQAFCKPWNGATQREQICDYYGFTGTKPTFTSGNPTQAEIDYFNSNQDKWLGYSNMFKNVIGFDIANLQSNYPTTTTDINTEKSMYESLSKIYPVPLKIIHSTDDPTVLYRYSEYLIRMITNAGGLARLRTFTGAGHAVWDYGDNVTTKDIEGNNLTMRASVYESIEWFKRFDR